MRFRCVVYMLSHCVLLGLDWAEPMMYLCLHVTYSCIFMHMYLQVSIFFIFYLVSAFLIVSLSLFLSLSLSLSLALVASWHPNANLLHLRILCILGLLLPLIPLLLPFGSMMRGPVRPSRRIFLDETLIQNAKSS